MTVQPSAPVPAADSRPAFTLVELIAIIVVLAILSGVAIPRYIDYSQRALITISAANLKVIARAGLAYGRDHGDLPPTDYAGPAAELSAYVDFSSLTWDARFVQPTGARVSWIRDAPTQFQLRVHHTAQQTAVWTGVDAIIDDGSLETGGVTAVSPANQLKWNVRW